MIAVSGTAANRVDLVVHGEWIGSLPTSGAAVALAFDEAESSLAVARPEGTTEVFPMNRSDRSRSVPERRHVIASRADVIVDIAFLDSERLVVAEESSVIRVWDIKSGRELMALLRRGAAATQIGVSPSGAIYSAAQDGELLFWSPEVFADRGVIPLQRLLADFCTSPRACPRGRVPGKPSAIAVHPKLEEIAIAYTSGQVFFYSLSDNRLTSTFEPLATVAPPATGLQRAITRIEYSPDGDVLATGNAAVSIAAHQRDNLTLHYSWRHAGRVSGVSLGMLDGRLRLFSSSFDGRIVMHSLDARRADIWPQDEPINAGARRNVDKDINSLALSVEDGRVVATRNAGPLIWNLRAFPNAKPMTAEDLGLPPPVTKIVWADLRGRILVDGELEGIQRVYNVDTNEIRTLSRYHWRIFKQEWDPNGFVVFALSGDGAIRAYDVARGYELFSRRLPFIRPNDQKDEFLDMQIACKKAGESEDKCLLVSTLGDSNRIFVADIDGMPRW